MSRQPAAPAEDPLDGLSVFSSSRLVVAGGFGSDGSGPQQWRSMWAAFKQYSADGSDPSKQEIERSQGCNYYHRDAYSLRLGASRDGLARWEALPMDAAAAKLFARTGHSLTSLQQRRTLLLFGGANFQQGGGPVMNDAWTVELDAERGGGQATETAVAELHAAGTRPSPRAHHTASLLGGAVYIVGGCGVADRPLRDVHRLDTRSWSWSQPEIRGRPPPVLSRHSATPMLGAIFVFGGCAASRPTSAAAARGAPPKQTYSSQLYVLCEVRDAAGQPAGGSVASPPDAAGGAPAALQWEAVKAGGQLPGARAEHGACAAGGRLFIFGGKKAEKARNRPSSAAAVASPYGDASAGAPASSRSVTCSELYAFDPRSCRWECVSRTPALRREGATLVGLAGEFLLAFGGWSGGGSAKGTATTSGGGPPSKGPEGLPWSNALHALSLGSMTWYRLAADGPPPAPRHGHAAVLLDYAETAPHACSLTGAGLSRAAAGALAAFRIVSRDALGAKRRAGGDLFRARLLGRGTLSGLEVAGYVNDHLDGSYTVSYLATAAGEYEVLVELTPPTPPPVAQPAFTGMPAAMAVAAMAAAMAAATAAERKGTATTAEEASSSAAAMAAAPDPDAPWFNGDPFFTAAPAAPPLAVGPTGRPLLGVAVGEAHGLRVVLPCTRVSSGSLLGPIDISLIDAFGNVLPGRCPLPHVAVTNTSQLSADRASAGAPPVSCELEVIDTEGRETVWLRLSGPASSVSLLFSQQFSQHAHPQPALQPAELDLVLTGQPTALRAACPATVAVAGRPFGPLRVSAVDAAGHATVAAALQPRLSVRRWDGLYSGAIHSGGGGLHSGAIHSGGGGLHSGAIHSGDGGLHSGAIHNGDGGLHSGAIHSGDGGLHGGTIHSEEFECAVEALQVRDWPPTHLFASDLPTRLTTPIL